MSNLDGQPAMASVPASLDMQLACRAGLLLVIVSPSLLLSSSSSSRCCVSAGFSSGVAADLAGFAAAH